MNSTVEISRVRQHLEKFINDVASDDGVKHLDKALELLEELKSGDDHRSEQILDNMFRTYADRFLLLCEQVCQNTDTEPGQIRNLLKLVESLKEYAQTLPTGILENILATERKLFTFSPILEPESKMSELEANFLALSIEEQNMALPILKSIGIDTKRAERARDKQLQRQEKLRQNWISTVLIRMVSGKDEEFLDLLRSKIHEASGQNLEIEKVKNFLSSSVQLTVTSDKDNDFDQPLRIVNGEKSAHEKVYTYQISKYGIVARMFVRNGSYVVLAGSTANHLEQESLNRGHRRKRQELISSGKLARDETTDLYLFVCDVLFNSPSEASSVISGSSTNGWQCFGIPRG